MSQSARLGLGTICDNLSAHAVESKNRIDARKGPGEVAMFRATIHAPDSQDVLAVGIGYSWEDAAFDGYDRIMRARKTARRYVALVTAEPSPGCKLVSFGVRRSDGEGIARDPVVAVDVVEIDSAS